MVINMKKAIVLSGGGSKGSYQLGVWKALRKLHIKYDIVTGTSIGALNGALMTQNTYFSASYIWNKLNLEYLFNQKPKSNHDIDVLKLFGKNIIKNGGMEIEKIESIIKKVIRPYRFYHSKIDFGLVTYNISTKKPVSISKKEIKPNQLVNYLMASATCFPAFQMKNIEGEKFIDGGVYDNLPINLALKLGADELIVVDLKAPGITKKPKYQKPTIYIRPRNNISFFLNFNEQQAKENRNFGYNDTMKTFQKLDGNLFTFKKGTIDKICYQYQSSLETKLEKKITKRHLLTLLETLGRNFELKEDKIYRLSTYKKQLQKKIQQQEAISKEWMKQIATLQPKKITNTKIITLYFLKCLENHKKIDKTLLNVFIKNYEQALLLQELGCYYGK